MESDYKTIGVRGLRRKVIIKVLFFFASSAWCVKSIYKCNVIRDLERKVFIKVLVCVASKQKYYKSNGFGVYET